MQRGHIKHVATAAVLVAAVACGGTGPEPCQVDADCSSGSVCELVGQQAVCVAAADAPIVIGQSVASSGTNQSYGNAVKVGVEAAFAEVNAAGGIRGRALVLDVRDDAYDPTLANDVALDLLDAQPEPGVQPKCASAMIPSLPTPVYDTALSRGPNAVLAMLGSVGTPTSQQQAAIAVETGTLYLGPITGSTLLFRDTLAGPCARFLFNVRASYAEEARATLELFMAKGVPDYRNLISFDQNDTYGQTGYDGLVAAYTDFIGPFPTTADPTNPIKRFRYTRNDDTSVPAQATAMTTYLAELLTNQTGTVTVGVMMTDTYGAATELIKGVRQWQYANDAQQTQLQKATRLQLVFSNVSFSNAERLADRIMYEGPITTPNGPKSLTEDVYVSQVVPNYANDMSSLVGDYNDAIPPNARADMAPTFLSLEGYLNARVLIVALLAHQGPFTPDGLATTLEQLTALPVGLTGSYGFSPMNHQYSSTVWGTALQTDGTYSNHYVWQQGSPIQILP